MRNTQRLLVRSLLLKGWDFTLGGAGCYLSKSGTSINTKMHTILTTHFFENNQMCLPYGPLKMRQFVLNKPMVQYHWVGETERKIFAKPTCRREGNSCKFLKAGQGDVVI
jgi:hypothetical protein